MADEQHELPEDDATEAVTEEAEADESESLDDFDEDDLRLLSDEERAALLGDEDDGESEAGEDEGSDDDTQPVNEDAKPVQDPAPQEDAPAPAAPAPIEVDTSQIIADADAARDEAFTKYEDGELTRDEYLAELKRIDSETAQARLQAEREAIEAEQVRAAFIEAVKGYRTEYPALFDAAHIKGFDKEVRALAADPAFDEMSHRDLMELAHERYLATAKRLGITAPAIKTAAPAEPAPAAKKPLAPKAEPPRTLARVPVASASAVSDGRWGELARIMEEGTPEQIEAAMARLTPEEAEAFASADI